MKQEGKEEIILKILPEMKREISQDQIKIIFERDHFYWKAGQTI
mgnify:CR=1 FL=1